MVGARCWCSGHGGDARGAAGCGNIVGVPSLYTTFHLACDTDPLPAGVSSKPNPSHKNCDGRSLRPTYETRSHRPAITTATPPPPPGHFFAHIYSLPPFSRLPRDSSRPCPAAGLPPTVPESGLLRLSPRLSPSTQVPPSEVSSCSLPIDFFRAVDGHVTHPPFAVGACYVVICLYIGRFSSASSITCSLHLVHGRFRHSGLQVCILVHAGHVSLELTKVLLCLHVHRCVCK